MPITPRSLPDFDPNDKSDATLAAIKGMQSLDDEADVRKLRAGTLFLAKFLHDPNGDDGWHVKQILDDLLSGKVIRKNLSTYYWRTHSMTRPPVAVSLGGKKYKVLG